MRRRPETSITLLGKKALVMAQEANKMAVDVVTFLIILSRKLKHSISRNSDEKLEFAFIVAAACYCYSGTPLGPRKCGHNNGLVRVTRL